MTLSERFPPLYECKQCGASVSVTPHGEGVEPTIKRSCGHDDAGVWANRKVTLRGKGQMNVLTKASYTIRLTLRQFLSALTKRSV